MYCRCESKVLCCIEGGGCQGEQGVESPWTMQWNSRYAYTQTSWLFHNLLCLYTRAQLRSSLDESVCA